MSPQIQSGQERVHVDYLAAALERVNARLRALSRNRRKFRHDQFQPFYSTNRVFFLDAHLTPLMLRKLGSYPRQNGLVVALRELGRIERTLFILYWLQSVELRRRVNTELNKSEARNALARAVFFYRLGEIRDRSFEQQRYRASGLNLVTAVIVL